MPEETPDREEPIRRRNSKHISVKKLRCGQRTAHNGEWWSKWMVFSPTATDEEISEYFWEWYNGPGRSFGGDVFIRRTKTRCLVTQGCGLDI